MAKPVKPDTEQWYMVILIIAKDTKMEIHSEVIEGDQLRAWAAGDEVATEVSTRTLLSFGIML